MTLSSNGRTGPGLAAGLWSAVTVLTAAVAGAQAIEPRLYPSAIPLGATDAVLDQDYALQLTVHSGEIARLAAQLRQTSVRTGPVSDGTLQLTLAGRDTLRGGPDASDEAASFVIDYDEAPVQELVEQLQQTGGARVSIDELSEFVRGQLTPTAYAKNFDIASQVAGNRTGDCSEHAILLTALARASGYPARTILGSLIVGLDDGARAFGHAWTEVHADGAWHLADATVPVSGDRPVLYYLPLGTIEQEGPGFGLAVLNVMTLMPQRFDGMRNVPARQRPIGIEINGR